MYIFWKAGLNLTREKVTVKYERQPNRKKIVMEENIYTTQHTHILNVKININLKFDTNVYDVNAPAHIPLEFL